MSARVPEQTAALEVNDVDCAYGGLRSVDDASFAIGPGEIVALIGPNGAGKTTLLNAITGLQQIESGSVRLLGRDVTRYPSWRRARCQLGRSFQLVRLFDDLSVIRNVELGLAAQAAPGFLSSLLHLPSHRAFRRAGAQRASAALVAVGLQELGARFASEISHGQGRRVEIARACVSDPRVLLLDEPSSGLHASAIGDLLPVLRARARQGTAVLLVEHNLRFVTELATRVIVMDRGRIIADGQPEAVLREPIVVAAYLGGRHDVVRTHRHVVEGV